MSWYMYIYHSKNGIQLHLYFLFGYVAKQALTNIQKLYFKHNFFHENYSPGLQNRFKWLGKQGLNCNKKKKVKHMKISLDVSCVFLSGWCVFFRVENTKHQGKTYTYFFIESLTVQIHCIKACFYICMKHNLKLNLFFLLFQTYSIFFFVNYS